MISFTFGLVSGMFLVWQLLRRERIYYQERTRELERLWADEYIENGRRIEEAKAALHKTRWHNGTA
jgi:hypothetical protein